MLHERMVNKTRLDKMTETGHDYKHLSLSLSLPWRVCLLYYSILAISFHYTMQHVCVSVCASVPCQPLTKELM